MNAAAEKHVEHARLLLALGKYDEMAKACGKANEEGASFAEIGAALGFREPPK